MEKAMLIIKALEKAGYKAYVVGGAVRNKLLGLPLHDIDILTSASPKAVEGIAAENGWVVKKVGAIFGVIIVVVDKRAYEVATSRTETYGRDSHRPEHVEYTSDVIEDLSRRDFTINAMAMDIEGNIIDPFGGQRDLKEGIIRAVGDPEERFSEDGLRPFRAIRFAAQLGFRIEENTFNAISKSLRRVRGLSVERVRDELERILLAPYAARGVDMLVRTGLASTSCCYRENGKEKQVGILPEVMHLVGLKQSPKYHTLDAWNHTLAVIDATPADLTVRWAALLHDVAKGLPGIRGLNKRGELSDHGHDRKGAEMAARILSRLKVYPQMARRVCWIVRNHMTLPEPDRKTIIKWLRRQSRRFRSQKELSQAVWQLFSLCKADIIGGMINPDFSMLNSLNRMVEEILKEVPFYESELAINGREVAEKLGSGPQVGSFLKSLLERVQAGELTNTEGDLKAALYKKVERLCHRGVDLPPFG